MKKKCASRYFDSFYMRTVRCHLKEGHSGNHNWFSWLWFLPSNCEYEWDDSVAIKNPGVIV